MLNRFRSIYSWLFVGLIVVMALVPWLFTSYGLQEADIAQRLCQPSSDHFMGCDVYGRDVWTHVLYGARTTLFVCIFTVFLTLALGTFLGIVAGFFGGVVDYLIDRKSVV